ncbi:hypothetical protein JXA84_08370, partial [candidate division WOR-3 bacterium]|nr:hypothetical protein [candidate division WOR-3 bacterium]
TRLPAVEQEVVDLTKEIMKTMEKTEFFSESKASDETKTTLGIYTKEENLISQPRIDGLKKAAESYQSNIYIDKGMSPVENEASQHIDETLDIGKKAVLQDDKAEIKNLTSFEEVKPDKTIQKEDSNAVKEKIDEDGFPGFSFKEPLTAEKTLQEEESEGNIDFL